MNKIKFVAINYWNKETMTLSVNPTQEQWAEVEAITKNLNEKYQFESGCKIHPDQIHEIVVGLFNNYIDIQVQKKDTCGCQKIVEKLLSIRDTETALLNTKK